MNATLPILSASRLRDARACQRLHRYRYGLGYRPAVEAETLRFGALVHAGLEAWWRAPAPERLTAALQAIAGGEADPFERARAEAMLRGYDARWDGEQLEVLAVEVEFATALVNPETGRPSQTWRLGGKIDAVVRAGDGRVLIVEHKTSSEDIAPGSDYWKRLRLDGQVSVYYEGARVLGHDVAGCLYDVLRKPALKPLKATAPEARKYKAGGVLYANQRDEDETPDAFLLRCVEAIAADPNGYFTRGEVVRLEIEMGEALFDVWQLGQQLREAERLDRYPRNPDSCVRYGKTCAFFPACCGEASLDDPTLYRRSTNIHPELTGTLDAA